MANPTLLDMPIARDGNKNTIPTTDNGTTGLLSQQYGWQLINAIPPQQGGKAVKREDFNGALYLLSNLLFYLQKGWQFEWDSRQAYYAGCIVKDTDGGLYCANTDVSASSTHPKDDAVNWSRYNSYALRSHSYKVGDTSSLPNIPAGYFLECTTAGTTAATVPVITPPVTAGQTISDRTVVWTVRKCFPTSGGALTGTSLTWNGNNLGGISIVSQYINGDTSNYIKLASGIILSWGRAIFDASETAKVVTFPVTYSGSFSYKVTATKMGGATAVGVENTSASTITIKIPAALGYENSAMWIAVGR